MPVFARRKGSYSIDMVPPPSHLTLAPTKLNLPLSRKSSEPFVVINTEKSNLSLFGKPRAKSTIEQPKGFFSTSQRIFKKKSSTNGSNHIKDMMPVNKQGQRSKIRRSSCIEEYLTSSSSKKADDLTNNNDGELVKTFINFLVSS